MNRVTRHRVIFALSLLFLTGASIGPLNAQEAEVGMAIPITITGGAMDTGRVMADDPSAPWFTTGFRVLATPELKLGDHWYVYSAIQVNSTPFFYDEAYSADRELKVRMLQGFAGYTRSWGKTSLSLRFGKLSSAFGSFPLRYNDTQNPLLDEPLPYAYLGLQPYGAGKESYGVTPVTLYGLPGAEVDLTWRRLDGRVQLTNSSPANPKGLFVSGQHPQWTAGAGYTIRQGFRVGVSAFRGPWLDNAAKSDLPWGSKITDFTASGLGIDAQWARGSWSASGEWDRFVCRYPDWWPPPAPSFGYVELKRILSPRWYVAFRPNYQANNHPLDSTEWNTPVPFPNRQAYEVAVGFRPDRLQLLKVGYEWMRVQGGPRAYDNVLGLQFVTSLNSISKAWK